MKTIEIKSAKIRSSFFLNFSYEERNEFKSEAKDFTRNDDIVNKSDLPMHEDCQQAFLNLIPHLVLICELEKPKKEIKSYFHTDVDGTDEDKDSLNKKYSIDEFSITGSGDAEGLVIKGTKFLSSGKTIKLVTPSIRLDDDNDYDFLEELNKRIDKLKDEVFQYLNGKHAPLPQQAMNFDEDDAFDAVDIEVMEVDDNDDMEFTESLKNPKQAFQDLKKRLKKDGVTMTITSSEDKGAA